MSSYLLFLLSHIQNVTKGGLSAENNNVLDANLKWCFIYHIVLYDDHCRPGIITRGSISNYSVQFLGRKDLGMLQMWIT